MKNNKMKNQKTKTQYSNRKIKYTRRQWLENIMYAYGSLTLKSLASGLPMSLLLNPLQTKASNFTSQAKMLILSASFLGDPFNANVPGSYIDQNIVHPDDARMTPQNIMLNGNVHTAALPWSNLSQNTLNQSLFFHHPTYTGGHTGFRNVMKLQNSTRNSEMFVSHFAHHLHQQLGTIQAQPICLSHQELSYQGDYQPILSPLVIKQTLLGSGDTPLERLKSLRNQTIDEMYSIFKRDGNIEQKKILDRFALSKIQAQEISLELLHHLSQIDSNSANNQAITAVILAAMNISPISTLYIPFGGDNHNDPGFNREITQLEQGVQTIQLLQDTIAQFQNNRALTHDIVFAWTSVFGRRLDQVGKEGRDHNSTHNATLILGPSISGGVIGNTSGGKLNSGSGLNDENGDINSGDTLASMGKTLGKALGLSDDILDEEIKKGKVIQSAIKANSRT